MKNDEKTFEKYFAGNMSSTEAKAFSAILANDKSIKDEYDYFLAVKKGAHLLERDQLRSKLAKIDVRNEAVADESPRKTNRSIITIIKWAGGIAAIFLIAFFAFYAPNQINSEDLFAQNFETYVAQAERGSSLDEMKEVYNDGDYNAFLKMTENVDETPELQMMIANAYMNKNQFVEAIKTLTKITDDSVLRDKKYWYLGLSNLKIGNRKEAIQHFNYLLSISNYKKTETEEILSSIHK
ncbi:tetratricopeptide repeat protein [Portibacter lacus]|uniref:Tetratricopeptide repeat protein n=1 Tax=Portibacter lacus TaxID=1099794 RepID=A0AA37SXH2_9BACT|nr:hypothetical protein [Portibacter lacus]GLR19535.1 hypothetical protein GCM10007940_41510 [Portibacter lacus]